MVDGSAFSERAGSEGEDVLLRPRGQRLRRTRNSVRGCWTRLPGGHQRPTESAPSKMPLAATPSIAWECARHNKSTRRPADIRQKPCPM